MALTKTTRLNLAKQDAGDTSWHINQNAGMDDADARLFQSGAGNPIDAAVVPHYAGQWYHETDADIMWLATTALATGWKKGTEIIIDTAANIEAMDADEFKNMVALAYDTGALYVAYDPAGGAANVVTKLGDVAEKHTATVDASTADDDFTAITSYTLVTGMDVSVVVPDDDIDYEIDVGALMRVEAMNATIACALYEDAVAKDKDEFGTWYSHLTGNDAWNPTMRGGLSLRWVNTAPTNNTTYQYRVYAKRVIYSDRGSPNPHVHLNPGVRLSRIWATLRPRVT